MISLSQRSQNVTPSSTLAITAKINALIADGVVSSNSVQANPILIHPIISKVALSSHWMQTLPNRTKRVAISGDERYTYEKMHQTYIDATIPINLVARQSRAPKITK